MMFNIYWINPLHTWWKVKKYFKTPKICIYKFNKKRYSKWYITTLGKFIDIACSDLQWKDKFNSPRHESNPKIRIVFFRRIGFTVEFTYGDYDTCVWETILDFLYYPPYKDNLVASVRNNKWGEFGSNKEISSIKYVRRKYYKMFKDAF